MSSKSYWDLTEHERAGLLEQEVERYTDYELMAAGVVRVGAPDAVPEPDAPEPDMVLYRLKSSDGYETDCAWATPEQAESAALGAMWLSTSYFGGYEKRVQVARRVGIEVIGVRAYSASAFDARKADLERIGEQLKKQAEQRKAYEESCKKQRAALEGMWTDWRSCQARADASAQVFATLAEYRELTGGDEDMARAFLSKAYDEDRIAEAEAWARGEEL